MRGFSYKLIGSRGLQNMTHGKPYEVLEHIPTIYHADANWLSPEYFVVRDDLGRWATLSRSRFEKDAVDV